MARCAAHRHRARSALIWTLAFVALAQLVIGLLIDYRGLAIRFPLAAAILNTLTPGGPSPDIICVGSSRFGCGIVPEQISRILARQVPQAKRPLVLNASTPGGDLITADYVLRLLFQGGARPALVVIEVSPETLNHYNEWFWIHVRRQLNWTDIPFNLVDICRAGQIVRLVGARFIPLHVHRQEIRKAVQRTCASWLARLVETHSPAQAAASQPPADANPDAGINWDAVLGRSRENPSGPQQERTTAGLIQPLRWTKHYHIGGASAAALESLLDNCRERKVLVILVGVPVTGPHRAFYTAAIESEYQQHMDRIVATYGCRYVDWRDHVPDALFLDNHHLLPEGGIVFSRDLAAEILTPAWRTLQAPADAPR